VNYSIQPAQLDDFEAICDLVILLKLIGDRSLITNTFVGSTYWVAKRDNETVGCIGLEHGGLDYGSGEAASLLRSAGVHPDLQGSGLGKRLANTAIDAARLRGDEALYLFSTHAGSFWQTFGFQQVDVWTLAAALPNSPQVRSGIERGWISDDCAWRLVL
jgi:N-acetylglutamate synthase-like GNAT family acetyltransferase